MATYDGGKGLPNNVIGAEREAFVAGLLSQVFPPTLRFVGGAVIDSVTGSRSGEIDVAVLPPTAPSFPMPAAGDKRLIFAENAAAVIEVKSNLSTQWSQVRSTTKQVRELKKHVRDLDDAGKCVVTNIPVYAVGYYGWKNVWKLKEKWEETPEDERPDAALMIYNPAFVSQNLQAEKDSALVAFIAHLEKTIRAHSEIQTDIMRYIMRPTELPSSG